MRESVVEKHLKLQVEIRNGICEKFVSPGNRGVPDRLVTWPNGSMELVETKAPDKGPRTDQRIDHSYRAKKGVRVWVLDTIEKVNRYVDRFPIRSLRDAKYAWSPEHGGIYDGDTGQWIEGGQ